MGTHSSILAWENPMDRGAWQATVHWVAKSRTRMKRLNPKGYFLYSEWKWCWAESKENLPWALRLLHLLVPCESKACLKSKNIKLPVNSLPILI